MESISKGRKIRLAIITFVVAAALPALLYTAQQSQDIRNRAQIEKDPLAPYITVTSPYEGASVTGEISISVSVLNNAKVVAVEYYLDNVLLGSVRSSPFAYSWNTAQISQGRHTILVRAIDENNNIGTKSITVYKE